MCVSVEDEDDDGNDNVDEDDDCQCACLLHHVIRHASLLSTFELSLGENVDAWFDT